MIFIISSSIQLLFFPMMFNLIFFPSSFFLSIRKKQFIQNFVSLSKEKSLLTCFCFENKWSLKIRKTYQVDNSNVSFYSRKKSQFARQFLTFKSNSQRYLEFIYLEKFSWSKNSMKVWTWNKRINKRIFLIHLNKFFTLPFTYNSTSFNLKHETSINN